MDMSFVDYSICNRREAYTKLIFYQHFVFLFFPNVSIKIPNWLGNFWVKSFIMTASGLFQCKCRSLH